MITIDEFLNLKKGDLLSYKDSMLDMVLVIDDNLVGNKSEQGLYTRVILLNTNGSTYHGYIKVGTGYVVTSEWFEFLTKL